MDLSYHWPLNQIRKEKDKIKKIFFYRVCGTGMGAAACLLKEAGYEVEGGDNFFAPPMSVYLEKTGIPLKSLENCDTEYLKSFDLIVVGNVVPKSSDDAALVESLKIPFCSFPGVLGALVLEDKDVVAIAGTHGKTTTTWFASQMFNKLGVKAGHFVGGVIPNVPSAVIGEDRLFFIEADEYDSSYFEKISKFRQYLVNNLILTSLEFDHGDIFNSIEDIKIEFRALLKTINKSVIFDETYPSARELSDEFKNIEWVGYGRETRPCIIEQNSMYTEFSLVYEGETHRFKTNVIGHHNILNLSGLILFAFKKGFSSEDIGRSIESLDMVKRRQEIRGSIGKLTIVDDFAHHPRAVKGTIETMKIKFPKRKIIVVFEANSSTARSDLFQKDFAKSLSLADKAYLLTPGRSTTVKNGKDLDIDKLSFDLNNDSVPTKVINNLDSLIEAIRNDSLEDSILLVLSNGTCLGLWKSSFIKEIK